MQDYTVVFLAGAGKEAGHVYEGYQRNVECVAEANETCALARCVAVEHAGEVFGLVGYDTYSLAVETGKSRCTSRNSPLSIMAPMTSYMS